MVYPVAAGLLSHCDSGISYFTLVNRYYILDLLDLINKTRMKSEELNWVKLEGGCRPCGADKVLENILVNRQHDKTCEIKTLIYLSLLFADSGAVFTFGKTKFAENIPSKFWF